MKWSSQTDSVVMSQHALEGTCAIAAAEDQVTIWHLLAGHHITTHATPNLQKTYINMSNDLSFSKLHCCVLNEDVFLLVFKCSVLTNTSKHTLT